MLVPLIRSSIDYGLIFKRRENPQKYLISGHIFVQGVLEDKESEIFLKKLKIIKGK